MIYRATVEKHEQVLRLADGLSYGGRKQSFNEVMDAALDALEEKYVRKRSGE